MSAQVGITAECLMDAVKSANFAQAVASDYLHSDFVAQAVACLTAMTLPNKEKLTYEHEPDLDANALLNGLQQFANKAAQQGLA